VIPSTSTGKFLLYKICNLVVSKNGIIKFKPGFKTLSNFHNNSTTLTVLGVTILMDKTARIISKIRANIITPSPINKAIIVTRNIIIGTVKRNIFF